MGHLPAPQIDSQTQPASGKFAISKLLDAQKNAEPRRSQHGNEHLLLTDQQNTGQYERGGDAIEQEYGVLLGKAPLEEFMMNVIGIGAEQRLLLKKASRHCKSDIHYRQSETQNRHGYAHDGRPSAPAVQVERSEREADEQAFRVV